VAEAKNLIWRIWALPCFFLTSGILGLALYLEPSPLGLGTHQQLGLEPCGFLTLVGVPCMMCGMTTSFSYYAHVQIVEGVLNQPFSLVLFTMTLFVCMISLLEFVSPRGRLFRFLDWCTAYRLPLILGMLCSFFASWIYKILIFI
jgi:hypothetical protein